MAARACPPAAAGVIFGVATAESDEALKPCAGGGLSPPSAIFILSVKCPGVHFGLIEELRLSRRSLWRRLVPSVRGSRGREPSSNAR